MTRNGYNATDRRPGINVRHASAARHGRLFYKLYAYMSLGVHRKVYSRRVLHVRRRDGGPAWEAPQLVYVLADDMEGRQVRESG